MSAEAVQFDDNQQEDLYTLRLLMLRDLAGEKGLQAALDAETLLDYDTDPQVYGWTKEQHESATVVKRRYHSAVQEYTEFARRRAENAASVSRRRGRRVLSAVEEVELFTQMTIGTYAGALLAEPGDFEKHEAADLRAKVARGRQARDQVIEMNAGLVASVAKRYFGKGVEFEDLQQEGMIGVARATETFDYSLGYKFSTYAEQWIRQTITRAIDEKGRGIRLPAGKITNIVHVKSAINRLQDTLHREPTIAEIDAELGWNDTAKVMMTLEIAKTSVSLDAALGDSDDSTRLDTVADERQETSATAVENAQLGDEIHSILAAFDETEQAMIRLRFGFDDGVSKSLEETAKVFGVDRRVVRETESRLMRQLRDPKTKERLADYHYSK